MKKIIRLTESQLVNIIKKVVEEQIQPDAQKKVTDCFTNFFKISKVPDSCMAIGEEMIRTKKAPNPFDPSTMAKCMACASALGQNTKVVMENLQDILGCLTKSSPVMY